MPDGKPNSTLRNLGEFFGHVWRGVTTDPTRTPPKPAKSASRVTKTQVQEETRETPAGTVVLRRTIIEEVVVPPKSPPPAGDAP